MRGLLTAARRRSRRAREERGAVAILVALSLTALLVASALILDFGLVRVDRQVNKSAADSAAMAGVHSLGSGNKAFPYRGVCSAIEYLQRNNPRFDGLTAAAGAWTNGNDVTTTANGCTDTTVRDAPCIPGDTSSWAKFVHTGTWQGEPIKVTIQSGYRLDAGTGADWSEEDLAAVQADNLDDAQGCYQLAVVITQNRDPGLGSLATSSDLVTSIRSVGRVELTSGGDAPAMLLLRRTGCPILETGSNAGTSYIHVYGAVSSDNRSQAGTIHADSDGSSCTGGSNQNIFLGRGTNGIVAYAAPQVLNPSAADPAKPGVLSTYAGSLGITGGKIRDSLANAHAASGLNETSPGTSAEPSGRLLVTRGLVDERYLGLGPTPFGVKQAVTTAQSVFGTINSVSAATAAGWKVIPNCDPTAAQITAAGITTSSLVYVDCTANSGYKGTEPINGATVLFAGSVKPPSTAGTSVSLPHATKVYIVGAAGSDAISIGNNSALKVHTNGNTDLLGKCTTGVNATKALMVIKSGQFKQTGGLLQLCRTTVITMGDRADACLPTSLGIPPTSTPCGGGAGDSQVSLTGTSTTIDWVAPNTIDVTTDLNGDALPAAVTAWHDANGPEDLALWTESFGGTSSPTYSMGGGGVMNTVGVFMVPNAAPFTISGGATQDLRNAQYIATSINLNGSNTAIKMRVDPNSAVTLPKLAVVGLVR